MATSYVVVCHDAGAEAYARPFFVQAKGLAIRHFVDEVNRQAPDNPMFVHFSSFNLFCLGTWDDSDAGFELFPTPELLMSGVNAKRDV